ncbi:MAG: SDR family NAD(P)-dependent oxidoreductase, partial [Planctomycetes bacterium]|nr:SDR family NAD(P)-dependent oxidoreductase [Planctomycetota bacterium]
NEISGWSLFAHLTFGLLEGWWLYEDAALRLEGNPGLRPKMWKEVLEEEGFESIFFPAQKARKFGQQIIAAGSDGVVRQRIKKQLQQTTTGKDPRLESTPQPGTDSVSSGLQESLREKSVSYFQKLVAETLKMSPQQVEPYKPLEEYGLDSILVVQLTNQLRKVFPEVTSTLFFEVQSINGLVDYFLENRKEELIAILPQETVVTFPDHVSPSMGSSITKSRKSSRTLRRGRQYSFEAIHSGSGHIYSIFDVAIIGMSGRYPKAKNLEEFWKNLSEGVNCVEEVPKERWNWEEYYDKEKGKSGKIYTKWGGFLEEIDKFDPLFFHISPREAELMDPQERLFLEASYQSIEDAAYTSDSLGKTRKIGVFVGVMNSRYTPQPGYSSIANRISYLLNFQGPSMAVDTACSSSLTAIHLALESIYSGLSECAIAGGVNLIIDPVHYLGLTEMTMLTSGNECRSFGEQADGFVDAEGVGAIVLKPLRQAEQDGDHIYGVLKGSAVNAGGKTNGYTVPNPKAQAILVSEALERSKVRAEQLSYVEAHGTGTSLGDPIEIAGLTRAFREMSDGKQFCSIGSVKSNIGHCESAAGIAGVTKILLQLHHKQLVPSLHSQVLNPEIDFTQTPFQVQQRLEEWKRPQRTVDGAIEEIPRIAGISSFGAGGANAHVIIEEHTPRFKRISENRAPISTPVPVIIPLSARSVEQLDEIVIRLIHWIQNSSDQINLQEIAYTLQTGRVAMEERLGLLVSSLKELEDKLEQYRAGKETIPDCYLGQVKRNREALSVITADDDMKQTIELWITKKKYSKILDLWVKGLVLDWNKLYGDAKHKRISLPTYPFARERYWVSKERVFEKRNQGSEYQQLNPLLHHNTSTLEEERFTSMFTGHEFFLNDHQVKGERVLPGVGYLEMARAAVEKASGDIGKGATIHLKNVVWAQPIVIDGSDQKVHIGLFGEDDGQIQYEVYTESGEEEATIVHSQGGAEFKEKEETPPLDIQNLQSQMNQGTLNGENCYQIFKEMGIEYGEGYRVIREIYQGENQLLARLSLPSSVQDTQSDYVLHPGLMDSALQSSIGLVLTNGASANGNEASPGIVRWPQRPSLPFALESLEILGSCTSEMYAWVRIPSDKVQKLDIDLCDEQGNVCVKMRGFTSRVIEGEVRAPKANNSIGTLLATPVWKERAKLSSAARQPYAERHILLCEIQGVEARELQSLLPGSHCENLKSEEEQIESRFTEYAVSCFEMIRKLLEKKPQGKVLIQILVPSTREQTLFAGLSGLLKTAALENPKLIGQLIEINPEETLEGLLGITKENSRYPQDSHIRYEEHKRLIASWSEVGAGLKPAQRLPWKDKGVYLITGGLGGLGVLFTREILSQSKDAKVILTGRSELFPQRQSVLRELQALGGEVDYQTVDVSNLEQVKSLVESIQDRYGKLDGIIHSAGVISDNFILKKRAEEFRKVLLPKVTGTVNLDKATRGIALDFFVLFSSGAGAMGNIGQADYATANAFMDRFAAYRNQLVDSKERKGQTLSINWPLWREGGMGVDAPSEAMMKQSTGMEAMKTETGIRAFYQSLNFNHAQVLVMEGLVSRMRKSLFSHHSALQKKSSVSQAATGSSIDTGSLLSKIQSMLIQAVSNTLKINIQDIDIDVEFNEYGFDSITLTDFANRLNEKYNLDLTPTLFFEHSTIGGFAGYLAREHESVFVDKFRVGTMAQTSIEAGEEKEETASTLKGRRTRFVTTKRIVNVVTGIEPVAIVGMSGCFPEAENLDQFWQNLVEEKDCISKIPIDRWDWKALYGDPLQEANKTNIKWGGFIKNVFEFDPLFFGISPREAELMDPQQRLLMTYVYLAIEDAGYSVSTLSGSNTGIFVGTGSSGYSGLIERAGIAIEGYTSTGMVPSVGPNRMSYFLNFHGPSEPIETACSSSLVAIHRALQAMDGGSCDAAVVGGINTIITPEAHISFNKAGMLCEDGRCKTFSTLANGYVRGEGVGMLFLKRLSQAEADGDHIYGLIRGSEENHGGKANSLTAPNPKAQAELLKAAYKKSGLDPKTISYIEAHGTGTELGDPIEINGLKTAFKDLYHEFGYDAAKTSHCGIGSVKSNIGHLELAAGVAGVIKVLLQFKHKRLVSTLHCKEINPYIDLINTPFYILRESRDWNCLKDESGQEIPRRAGVSSFGFGGANAHVVLEEYIAKKSEAHSIIEIQTKDPVIIPLSARTKDQLEQRARDLFELIHASSLIDLQSLAYSLQVGREAMEERLGLIVTSIRELEGKLGAYLSGNQEIEDFYQGEVKRNKDALAVFTVDEDLQKATESWINKRKYSKILDLWVKGLVFDWNKLYGVNKPRRISLPTYPFSRERYWIAETPGNLLASTAGASVSIIHPLLHENTSDLTEQRFTSTFTGKEFLLHDHKIKGKKVLPGVCYLEMARAAVEKALRERGEGTTIHLKHVVWSQPIVIDGPARKVHIGLFGGESGQIQYEVYTESDNEEESIVHSQGVAEFKEKSETHALDIKELQSHMNQGTLNADSCYKAFKEMGMDYGEGHREIYQGEKQVLARLSLPSSVQDTKDEYVLHPSIMDSAIQSSIGLMLNNGAMPNSSEAPLIPSLPFSLESLEIVAPCTSEMYSWVRYSGGSAPPDKVQRLDIDLCDGQGNVCVKMRGLSIKVKEVDCSKVQIADPIESLSSPSGLIMMTPVWDTVSSIEDTTFSTSSHDSTLIIGENRDHTALISQLFHKTDNREISPHDTIDTITGKLKDLVIKRIVWVASNCPVETLTEEAIINDQNRGVLQVLRILKSLIALGYEEQQIEWTLITVKSQRVKKTDGTNPTHAALQGFVGSMAKEYPLWIVRLIDLPDFREYPIEEIGELPYDVNRVSYAYRENEWFQQRLIPIKKLTKEELPYRHQGVYVVIGGAGGIGEVWSQYMIEKYEAQIIWIGRRDKDEEIQEKLDRLSGFGTKPEYVQADASVLKELQTASDSIKKRYGKIDGVVHSAVGIFDESLKVVEEEDFQKILSVKIDISVRIAQVFRKESLDFLLFFSSTTSFSRAGGMSGYSAGCTFKDSFALQLSKIWSCKVKVINWGYWNIGTGDTISQHMKKRVFQSGIRPIAPEEAMNALEMLFSGTFNQIAVLKTLQLSTNEQVTPNEWISCYPCHNSSSLTDKHLLETGTKGSHIALEGSKNDEMEEQLCQLLHANLRSTPHVIEFYKRWLKESENILRERHCSDLYKETERTGILANCLDEIWGKWEQAKEKWLQNSDKKASITLVETCMRALPDILTGKQKATDVLFPNSSLKLVEGVYKGNRVADYFNEVLGNTLETAIQARLREDPSAQIRILEIGAGTGGATSAIMPRLRSFQNQIAEYCYTDISKAFLFHAEECYQPQAPYLSTQIFNVELPIVGQNIAGDRYDFVIAANVLYATKNVRNSLRNAKAVLHEGGMLLLNEVSDKSIFAHLTFGLLEGWWLNEDDAVRIPGAPGLYPETWERVLEDEGFYSVLFPAKTAHNLGQQIIIATSDGIVRQKEGPQRKGIRKKEVSLPNESRNPQLQVPIDGQARGKMDDLLRMKTLFYFKQLLAKILKMDIQQIDSSEPLESYGIDSIIIGEVNNRLREDFEDISSTLLFEFQTLDALTEHFIKTQKERLVKLLRPDQQSSQEHVSTRLTKQSSKIHPERIVRNSRSSRSRCTITFDKSAVPPEDPIAIIGISGMYPQAETLDHYWQNLKAGKDCITEIPSNRWSLEGFYHPNAQEAVEQGKSYSKWGGFVDQFAEFDPLFFNISPREAMNMDPQERLFLQASWKALEDAGYTRTILKEEHQQRAGVFAGITRIGYALYGPELWKQGDNLFPHNSFSSVANRLSYFLNVQGPSMPIDTMCSSSLTAIHEACEHIHRGECNLA